MVHENSDETSKQIKTEFIEDLDTNIVSNKQCDNQNISTKLQTEFYLSSNTANDINISLNEHITSKTGVIEKLPKCYVDVQKQDNELEKQSINKWTIDEDKIILQTCKRVEDIEVLLETINRRIPQRSVSEVKLTCTHIFTDKIILFNFSDSRKIYNFNDFTGAND
jgi:hypothetical protein